MIVETKIVLVYPDLLGTYGDSGNAEILAVRAQMRGLKPNLITVNSTDSIPIDGDIYVIGGGEDGPQQAAVSLCQRDGGLKEAFERGAQFLAICAGFQILGYEFPVAGSQMVPGLGILPVRTVRTELTRCVGELLVDPDPLLGIPLVTGYENHGGQTEILKGRPLGKVIFGIGNSYDSHFDGFLSENVVASYCHGPLLARNPAIADRLLMRACGSDLDEVPVDSLSVSSARLRSERISAVTLGRYEKRLFQMRNRIRDLHF